MKGGLELGGVGFKWEVGDVMLLDSDVKCETCKGSNTGMGE